jgi:exodeoxyribonuclease V beta subunit
VAGLVVHEALEHVPLVSFLEAGSLAGWAERGDVRGTLEAALSHHGLGKRHRPSLERLVFAAMTAPLPLDPPLAGVARASRLRREVEIMFPIPERDAVVRRGWVQTIVDVVLEHGGLTYFLDWKTDSLPDYTEDTLRERMADAYDLQARLYSLALARALGIRDEATHRSRFGGYAYVFVRGLDVEGATAVHVHRPSFETLVQWDGIVRTEAPTAWAQALGEAAS